MKLKKIKDYLKQKGYGHAVTILEKPDLVGHICEWFVKNMKKDKVVYNQMLTEKEFRILEKYNR